ncbi:MAG: hypothetical protein AAGD11_04685 [Planctomycetota bacterium]
MEYTFRLNLFTKPKTLRLYQQSLEVLDDNRRLVRRIELDEVYKLQQFKGMNRTDPDTGRFEVKFCKVFAKRHATLSISNCSYIASVTNSRDGAINHGAQYSTFVKGLKEQVAELSPDIPIVYGARFASLLWWGGSLLGLLMFAVGIAGFFMDEPSTAVCMALFFLPAGAMLIFGGAAMGRRYWPQVVPLREEILREEI